MKAEIIKNYVGQLRIYSLVDLVILLIAARANRFEFVGVIFLHIGFLAYLESRHAHVGRNFMPQWLWIVLISLGIFFYLRIEIILFLLCSYFYTKKNKGNWGIYSPFCRGLQCLFLIGGITSYGNFLPWLVFVLIFIRNAVGDWRDLEKDTKNGMHTLPMIIGIKSNLQYGHLLSVILTSTIWWSCTNLSVFILLGVFVIQIGTYKLTPR